MLYIDTESPAKIAHSAASVLAEDDNVTGSDVTDGGGGNKASSTFVSRQRRPTLNTDSGNDVASSQPDVVSTADFSQQTVQDCATQTPVAVRLFCRDGGGGDDRTTYHFLNVLDNTVMSRDPATADQPWCMCLTDAKTYYASAPIGRMH